MMTSPILILAALAMAAGAAGAQASGRHRPVPAWNNGALTGQPVDIAPWTYRWRADRTVQPDPEACLVPRRLTRIDRVYRTAKDALPPDQLKSIYYDQPDILRTLPPAPSGRLLAGALWVGGLVDYQVQLRWPAGAQPPQPNSVELRSYPTAFGWFGWTVDRILADPVVSDGGRTWTFQSDPADKMDGAYSSRLPAATEMVAVFGSAGTPIPQIGITGHDTGRWQRADITIEWDDAASQAKPFDCRLEPHVAILGPSRPRPGGVELPVLYSPSIRPGLDSRVTIWTRTGGVTFSIKDLAGGPIKIPSHGLRVTRTDREGAAATEPGKGFRQMTREHREAASWDELMQEVRLWTCPDGTPVPPFPPVPDPAMKVEVSDQRWTDAWRAACDQMRGRHLWPTLGHEIGRAAHDMELVGLHAEVQPVYDYFLASPGVKSDGDYTDGKGSLEWAKALRHDMGYSHEGTHASTGRLLFSMCERYFLTGDREGFLKTRQRLQAAADWIISERRRYLEDVPNRKDMMVAGLMPPAMLGDYALPACDWHWYYCDNALALQGLQRFADALSEVDAAAGKRYQAEATAFRKDLRRALEREAALAPVRRGRDGMYHSYLPRMAYNGGLAGPEMGAQQFPDCDLFWGSLPIAEPFAALPADDYRVVGTIDAMDEMGTVGDLRAANGPFDKPLKETAEARSAKGLPASDTWFWKSYAFLPKISHNANVYLLQDDIPSFLRFWMNSYAGMVGANGKLWEHWHLGSFAPCDTPDTMTAGWFLENYRNLLVMEEGKSLWIAKGTPRAWLGQGKRITVANAPTYFGTAGYEIVSDVDHGIITATLHLPTRNPAKSVLLRLRHPQATPIQSVTVNGHRCRSFDPARELVRLAGYTGTVEVRVRY